MLDLVADEYIEDILDEVFNTDRTVVPVARRGEIELMMSIPLLFRLPAELYMEYLLDLNDKCMEIGGNYYQFVNDDAFESASRVINKQLVLDARTRGLLYIHPGITSLFVHDAGEIQHAWPRVE